MLRITTAPTAIIMDMNAPRVCRSTGAAERPASQGFLGFNVRRVGGQEPRGPQQGQGRPAHLAQVAGQGCVGGVHAAAAAPPPAGLSRGWGAGRRRRDGGEGEEGGCGRPGLDRPAIPGRDGGRVTCVAMGEREQREVGARAGDSGGAGWVAPPSPPDRC
ncbi:unnamed protein product [Boreogadus saida]